MVTARWWKTGRGAAPAPTGINAIAAPAAIAAAPPRNLGRIVNLLEFESVDMAPPITLESPARMRSVRHA